MIEPAPAIHRVYLGEQLRRCNLAEDLWISRNRSEELPGLNWRQLFAQAINQAL